MKKLKVGLFIDTWFPMIDGVINVVNNYAERLMKVADVTVFTCGTKKKDERKYPYKVVRGGSIIVPFMDYELPTTSPKLQKALKEANLDIVHIHSPFTLGKIGVDYAKKYHVPVVATLHSQYYQDFYRYTKSKVLANNFLKGVVKIFNDCDKVFTVNEKMADVAEKYGITPRPAIHYNGTQLEYMKDTKLAYDFFEKKFGIKQDEIVLLFVGRINKVKNLVFLIDSLYHLKNMGQKFKMLFVGSGTDRDLLEAKVKKLHLSKEVVFTGKVTERELVYAYARAKLFLFPSFYDSDGLVRIEAASQKLPVLLIHGSVASGMIDENVNGYLAENDEKKYAKKIKEILKDEEKYKVISENAYNDLYVTWDKTVAKMYQKYMAIIDKYKEEMTKKDNKKQREINIKMEKKFLKESQKKEKNKTEKEKKENEKLKKQKAKMIGKDDKSRVDRKNKKDII